MRVPAKKKKRYTVYIYKNKRTDEVFYVGCTSEPKTRDSGHKKKEWYGETNGMIIMREFNNRVDAESMEKLLIRKLNPIYNVQLKHNHERNKIYKQKRIGREKTREKHMEFIKNMIKIYENKTEITSSDSYMLNFFKDIMLKHNNGEDISYYMDY